MSLQHLLHKIKRNPTGELEYYFREDVMQALKSTSCQVVRDMLNLQRKIHSIVDKKSLYDIVEGFKLISETIEKISALAENPENPATSILIQKEKTTPIKTIPQPEQKVPAHISEESPKAPPKRVQAEPEARKPRLLDEVSPARSKKREPSAKKASKIIDEIFDVVLRETPESQKKTLEVPAQIVAPISNFETRVESSAETKNTTEPTVQIEQKNMSQLLEDKPLQTEICPDMGQQEVQEEVDDSFYEPKIEILGEIPEEEATEPTLPPQQTESQVEQTSVPLQQNEERTEEQAQPVHNPEGQATSEEIPQIFDEIPKPVVSTELLPQSEQTAPILEEDTQEVQTSEMPILNEHSEQTIEVQVQQERSEPIPTSEIIPEEPQESHDQLDSNDTIMDNECSIFRIQPENLDKVHAHSRPVLAELPQSSQGSQSSQESQSFESSQGSQGNEGPEKDATKAGTQSTTKKPRKKRIEETSEERKERLKKRKAERKEELRLEKIRIRKEVLARLSEEKRKKALAEKMEREAALKAEKEAKKAEKEARRAEKEARRAEKEKKVQEKKRIQREKRSQRKSKSKSQIRVKEEERSPEENVSQQPKSRIMNEESPQRPNQIIRRTTRNLLDELSPQRPNKDKSQDSDEYSELSDNDGPDDDVIDSDENPESSEGPEDPSKPKRTVNNSILAGLMEMMIKDLGKSLFGKQDKPEEKQEKKCPSAAKEIFSDSDNEKPEKKKSKKKARSHSMSDDEDLDEETIKKMKKKETNSSRKYFHMEFNQDTRAQFKLLLHQQAQIWYEIRELHINLIKNKVHLSREELSRYNKYYPYLIHVTKSELEQQKEQYIRKVKSQLKISFEEFSKNISFLPFEPCPNFPFPLTVPISEVENILNTDTNYLRRNTKTHIYGCMQRIFDIPNHKLKREVHRITHDSDKRNKCDPDPVEKQEKLKKEKEKIKKMQKIQDFLGLPKAKKYEKNPDPILAKLPIEVETRLVEILLDLDSKGRPLTQAETIILTKYLVQKMRFRVTKTTIAETIKRLKNNEKIQHFGFDYLHGRKLEKTEAQFPVMEFLKALEPEVPDDLFAKDKANNESENMSVSHADLNTSVDMNSRSTATLEGDMNKLSENLESLLSNSVTN